MARSQILILLILFLAAITCDTGPVVETQQGLIRGQYATDGDYSMFLGIPYARVNESNVFGAPIPHERFDDVFNAYDDGAICPQIEEFNHTIVGTLDCLHLNIYAPNNAAPNNRVPVFVYIYGGGFQIGFAGRFLYGPSYLVRHDIILVTISYRLGPYGFMCLDTPEVPGNQGLKDQLLGLRWIKNNIEAFGGDADKITIGGNSAGGMCADLHMYSEPELLYNQIVFQSGTADISGAVGASDNSAPLRLATTLGLVTQDTNEAIAYLSGLPISSVIAAYNTLSMSLGPCVEKKIDGVESFLIEHPLNSPIPNAKNVKVLAGYNNHELLSVFAHLPAVVYPHLNFIESILTGSFNFGDDLDEMAALVRRFYIGDEDMSIDLKWQLIDLMSDFMFNHPTHRTIAKYLSNEAQEIYLYLFSYSGGRNFVKHRDNINVGGAVHADEIGYLFDISYMDVPTPEDQLIVDQMAALWANFIKYGDPTPQTSELLPVKWLPVTKDRMNYLHINKDLIAGARPFHNRTTFWDLFYEMNDQYLVGKK